MLNKRHAAAQKVARHLKPTERAIVASMRSTAELTLAIIAAREEAGVAISLGAEALTHNAEAGVVLATAWSRTIATHQALRRDQHEAGLDAFSYGDNDTCVKILIPSSDLADTQVAAA